MNYLLLVTRCECGREIFRQHPHRVLIPLGCEMVLKVIAFEQFLYPADRIRSVPDFDSVGQHFDDGIGFDGSEQFNLTVSSLERHDTGA
ncbi:hypothetical protein GCM10017578_25670 [Microbacterium laevaniformans]|nr:hypothetical protein GCM10017578_25670 [Microbacterium laevaniformans]